MSFVPKPQEIYKHFKGKLYQVITLAEHTETGETLVIYQALYGDFKVYARELQMFTSKVDKVKYPDCTQEYRFERYVTEGRTDADAQGAAVTQAPAETQEHVATQAPAEMLEHVATQAPAGTREATVAQAPAGTKEATVAQATAEKKTDTVNEEPELELDPLLLEFLDAKDYESKLNVLVAVHHRITQDMITTMAVACDVEVEDGDLETRYAQLKNCLMMLEKYECNRLR